jgi:hypothetical protein
MYFHFDYLHESLEQGGAVGPDGVGLYMLRIAKGTDPVAVQQAVDGMFENGPQRVQTTTEAEFNRQFISMLGDVPTLLQLVGGAVLFAIFFAVLNTMLMAGRERTRDLGILKALGFTDRTTGLLLVGESVLVCGLGALLGVGIAFALEAPFAAATASFIPGFGFDRTRCGSGRAWRSAPASSPACCRPAAPHASRRSTPCGRSSDGPRPVPLQPAQPVGARVVDAADGVCDRRHGRRARRHAVPAAGLRDPVPGTRPRPTSRCSCARAPSPKASPA